MKRLAIIFSVSLVQALSAMEFPITDDIKENMKQLHPATLCPTHPKPTVEHCKVPNRILIARMEVCFSEHRYVRFETDEQVKKLVDTIEGELLAGKVWKIGWFYYDPVQEVTKFYSYIRDQYENSTESLSASDDNPYLSSYEDARE